MKSKPSLTTPATSRFILLFFLGSFVFIMALMYFSPFMSDDYEFSSLDFANLGDLLDYSLHYGNGRLFGNIGNVFLLESLFLRLVVKAGVIAGLITLLPVALRLKSKLSFLVSFLLLLGVSPSMFAQVYTWTSGFQNYVPPLLILLLSYMLWDRADSSSAWKQPLTALALFVLGLSGQLYAEHSSILSILLGFAAVVFSLRSHNHKGLASLSYFIGTLAGGILMLGIPHWFESAYKFSGIYRRVLLDSFSSMVNTVYTNLLQLVYFFSAALPLCLILGLATYTLLQKTRSAWKNHKLFKTAEGICLIFPAYALINRVFFPTSVFCFLSDLRSLIFAALCLAFLAVMLCAALHLENKRMKAQLIVFLAAAVMAMAPLLIVNPVAERCVLESYLFLSAAALAVLENLETKMPIRHKAFAVRLGAIICTCLAGFLLYAFSNIHWVNNQRINYITDKLQEQPTEISICRIPSDYTFSDSSYYLGTWYYNEEPHDIEFTFTDFSSWQARRRAEGWYDQK